MNGRQKFPRIGKIVKKKEKKEGKNVSKKIKNAQRGGSIGAEVVRSRGQSGDLDLGAQADVIREAGVEIGK